VIFEVIDQKIDDGKLYGFGDERIGTLDVDGAHCQDLGDLIAMRGRCGSDVFTRLDAILDLF